MKQVDIYFGSIFKIGNQKKHGLKIKYMKTYDGFFDLFEYVSPSWSVFRQNGGVNNPTLNQISIFGGLILSK